MGVYKKTTIIGAGAWGTALGMAAYRAGQEVTLWSVEEDVVDAVNNTHHHPALANVTLPDSMQATSDLTKALDSDIWLMVVPAQIVRRVCEQMQALDIAKDVPIVIACKGIERETYQLVSEIVAEYLPNPIAVISGPNFADEVARGEPAGTTLACGDAVLGEALVDALGSQTFRTYYSDDIIGAQIGGSVKNVLAIACGISTGKGYGENTKVALVTRGLVEMGYLCEALGGKAQTLLGMCGVGDTMLTCGTQKSRNMALGVALGKGVALEKASEGKTIEGVATAQSVHGLRSRLSLDMPICDAVYRIVYENADIDEVISSLLKRPLSCETSL